MWGRWRTTISGGTAGLRHAGLERRGPGERLPSLHPLPPKRRRHGAHHHREGNTESVREPLEVHRCGGEERLDAHVREPTAHGAGQPAAWVLASPWKPSERQRWRRWSRRSSWPQRSRRKGLTGARDGRARSPPPWWRATATGRGRPGRTLCSPAPRRRRTCRGWSCFDGAAELAARALQDVVPGVVAEPPERDLRADRLGFGRDHGGDATPLRPAEDLRLGVACVRGHRPDRRAGRLGHSVEALLAPVRLARGDLDVERHAEEVVHDAVLLGSPGLSRRLRAVVAVVASGWVRQTVSNRPVFLEARRACSPPGPRFGPDPGPDASSPSAVATASTCRTARPSQVTSARIGEAAACATSPPAIPAVTQA